jgi:hypothetical protein
MTGPEPSRKQEPNSRASVLVPFWLKTHHDAWRVLILTATLRDVPLVRHLACKPPGNLASLIKNVHISDTPRGQYATGWL